MFKKTRQTVQAGLGTTPDRGIIQSIWVEIPANCDLECPYCFCATVRNERDERTDNLAWNPADPMNYLSDIYVTNIFEPFAKKIEDWNQAAPQQRVDQYNCPVENAYGQIRGAVALPGAGEPFHPDNLNLTLRLIQEAKRLRLHLTIFTTAHWINDDLAEELASEDIVLLVKYNSSDRNIQNFLVGQEADGYFYEQRQNALHRLIEAGFNKPFGTKGTMTYQKSRLGIVTSVMKENAKELPELLRFARSNNIVFDCDTILERGRGEGCSQNPPDDLTKAVFMKLQQIDAEEFDTYWDISRSYVGTVCDRFRHHLYIDRTGKISPCVGAVDIDLGNVKSDPCALYDAWDSPMMSIIRAHHYSGVCTECKNYLEHKCYSCLGRCREITGIVDKNSNAQINSVGCWNKR